MGTYLSIPKQTEKITDVVSKTDRRALLFLLFFHVGFFYGMGMIFGTLQIVDHWRGPRGDKPVRYLGILSAMILSTAWPLTVVYFWLYFGYSR